MTKRLTFFASTLLLLLAMAGFGAFALEGLEGASPATHGEVLKEPLMEVTAYSVQDLEAVDSNHTKHIAEPNAAVSGLHPLQDEWVTETRRVRLELRSACNSCPLLRQSFGRPDIKPSVRRILRT